MNLEILRKSHNLSQEDLANAIGIKKTTYWSYENGRTQPDFETLIKLADYFNCSVDYILDHKSKDIIYKSNYSPEQIKLFKKIASLSELNCAKVDAYIDGLQN